MARKLCEFLGTKSLASVTPIDIGDFLTKTLPNRWEDRYISDQLGPLRSFFDFLYLGGVVDSVAPRFLKARARSKPLPRTLTQSEVRKVIATASHPRDKALIELLYATGCRIGEIRLARVEDIDFGKRAFRVRGKRKERIVYFGVKSCKSPSKLPEWQENRIRFPGQDCPSEGIHHLLQESLDRKLEGLPHREEGRPEAQQVARKSFQSLIRASAKKIQGISQNREN